VSIAEAKARIEQKLVNGLNARAEALRAEWYTILQIPPTRTGIQYPGLPNRSSASGEPPAPQSRRLQESIAVLSRATQAEPVSTVGPRPEAFSGLAPYPVYLEFGTRRMAPRPSARQAVNAFRQKVQGALANWPGGDA
jgi:hypothetical protein